MPQPNPEKLYTYQDYMTWDDDERWEIIEGVPYNMSPAPMVDHQLIGGQFFRILANKLQGNECIPFIAPTDVILSERNVVQPDVFVVCDRSKITKKNIQGAPDMIFEVISPSTAKKDRWKKKLIYEKYGVKEYIMADPEGRYIERYILSEDGHYKQNEFIDTNDTLVLKSLPGIEIPLPDVFGTALELTE